MQLQVIFLESISFALPGCENLGQLSKNDLMYYQINIDTIEINLFKLKVGLSLDYVQFNKNDVR